jgi:phosphotransferase system enzyme I (PtsP)
MVVDACKKANVELSLCGEMAGRPIEAMALLGVGLRTLSMAPGGFGPVKSMVRALDLTRFTGYLDDLMTGSQRSVRDSIRLFARDHGIPL